MGITGGRPFTTNPCLGSQFGFDSDYICGTGVRAFAAAGARNHR